MTPFPLPFSDATALARLIDHTLLKPVAMRAEIEAVCHEAVTHGFWSVCIAPFWVPFASGILSGSAAKVCTVIGFPLGNTSTAAKAAETSLAVQNGAGEIDMVINIGALKSGDRDAVRADIAAVVAAAAGAPVKAIFETCLLTDGEKVAAAQIAVAAGASFVKTSTGFSTGGASVADVALLRKTVGAGVGVKASGGVRDLATAAAMVRAGANRLGTSSGVALMKELEGQAPARAPGAY